MFNNAYYHKRVRDTLNFIIPPGKKVLMLGSLDGSALAALSPSKGVGIESDEKLCKIATKNYPKLKFINSSYEKYKPEEKFDFIIVNGVLGQSADLVSIPSNLQKAMHPSTRLLIYQHNYLWQWIISLAEDMKWKRGEKIQNWLSVGDTSVYLMSMGFEVTRVFRRTLSPLYIFGLGPL